MVNERSLRALTEPLAPGTPFHRTCGCIYLHLILKPNSYVVAIIARTAVIRDRGDHSLIVISLLFLTAVSNCPLRGLSIYF